MESDVALDVDLRRYLSGLRRRKVLVGSIVVLAAAAALGISFLQSPRYAASAQVVLESPTSESLFNQSTPAQTDPQVSVATEVQVIKSPPVQAAVEAKIGPVSKVSASQVGQTLVITVTGYAGTAARAAQVANAYADAYLALTKQRAQSQLLQAGRQIQTQITTIQSQIATIDQQLANGASSDQADLGATRTSLSTEQDSLRQQLAQVQVEASLASGGAQPVASASPPHAPVQPTPVRNVGLGVAAGLLFGIALACGVEYLDDTIRSAEELERLHPLPVLAPIPNIEGRARTGPPPLVLHQGRRTAAAEAYRALRTSVQLLGVVRPLTVIEFTSPTPGEGKTTTVANLATVLADAGKRVVVVDCDLRRSLLHQVFGLSNDKGLTSVLVGEASLEEAVRPAPGFEGLFVLTAGAPAPNPSELLSLKQTSHIIFELQSRFDLVLLDSPPVLPVTDAVVLSEWVEAVVVVTASGSTRRKVLRRALQVLAQAGAPVVGLVFNRAAPEPGYAYSYEHPRDRSPNGSVPSAERNPAPRDSDGTVVSPRTGP